MLIIRSLDSLAFPRPGTCSPLTVSSTQDAILACQCKPGTPAPQDGRLRMKLMRQGREDHLIAQRPVTLDEDAYLILNRGPCGASIYRGDDAAWPFTVFIGDDTLAQSLGHALGEDNDTLQFEDCINFLEHLRPLGDEVSLRLQHLAREVDADVDDMLWFDEQLVELLSAAMRREREWQAASRRIGVVKAATRQELLRRVLMAADFIWSHYEQPLTLDDIAGAARLSRYHLVRLFRQVHGVTPHACLMAKRVAVAERLLSHTRLDMNGVAARAGFGTRWSLFRHLRKRRGAGGEALRRLVRESGEACTAADAAGALAGVA